MIKSKNDLTLICKIKMFKVDAKSSDYYYAYDKANRKYYFNRIDGKRVAARDIPKSLIDKIEIKNSDDEKAEKVVDLNEFKEQLKRINKNIQEQFERKSMAEQKIKKLEEEIVGFDSQSYDDQIKRRKSEQKRSWENFIYSSYFRDVPPAPKTEYKDEDVLKRLNITTKKEWKEWLLKNHPDKNPSSDQELVTKVIAQGKLRFC